MSDQASAPAAVPVDEAAETARLVAQIANDFKGRDTVILDMRKITPIVDFFVITTMTNTRQMRAMGDEVVLLLKRRGIVKRGSEGGEGDSVWTLHDFGDVVLHAFSESGRALYDLEGLWSDAPRTEVRGSEPVPEVLPPPAVTDESDDDSLE